MPFVLRAIVAGLIILIAASTAYAETRYISDYLIVTVRSGKGNQYKILETLPTGTPVEIIEEDQAYAKVTTPNGTTGYIRQQYLTAETPKATQIKNLEQQLADLQQEMEQSRAKTASQLRTVGDKEQKLNDLTEQLQQSQRELKQVKADYSELREKSENVVNLASENEQLIEENNKLNSELVILREENRNFHRSNMIQWFLAGAGVFFGGWLIGKVSRKKQRFSRL
jgi:SH3 domain protein